MARQNAQRRWPQLGGEDEAELVLQRVLELGLDGLVVLDDDEARPSHAAPSRRAPLLTRALCARMSETVPPPQITEEGETG